MALTVLTLTGWRVWLGRRFQNLNWDAEISNLMAGEDDLYESVTQGQLFWEREGPQRPGRRTDV